MPKSARSKATEFNSTERYAIKERDKYKCVYKGCSRTFGIAPAHIFLPRSKSGMGVKENGVLLCQHHHHLLDNGRDSRIAKDIQEYCEQYLHNHYGDIDIESIKYTKYNKNIFKFYK